MTNQPEPIRPIIRATEAHVMKFLPAARMMIISKAQELAAANQDERTIDILAIVKRRIIRKAAQ